MGSSLKSDIEEALVEIAKLPGGRASRALRDALVGLRFDFDAAGERVRVIGEADGIRIESIDALAEPSVVLTAEGLRELKDGASLVDLVTSGELLYRGRAEESSRSYNAVIGRLDQAVRAARLAIAALPPKDPSDARVDLSQLPPPVAPPVVTVFGAGVTGLTAAHELVERGFRVQVVERMREPNRAGFCRVGGVAATQECRLPKAVAGRIASSERPSWIPWGIEFFVHVTVDPETGKRTLRCAFDPELRERSRAEIDPRDAAAPPRALTNAERLPKIARAILEAAKREAWRGSEPVRVRVRARYSGTDPLDMEAANRRAEIATARVLRALAEEAGPDGLPPETIELVPIVERVDLVWETGKSVTSDGTPRFGSVHDRVDFRVEEPLAPGEHGYRFFPSFFHNLFDTMRRIPLYEGGQATDRTALANLVETRKVTFAVDGELHALPRARVRSFQALQALVRAVVKASGCTLRDAVLMELCLLRYLTSSPERRAELESKSWAEYIGIENFSPPYRRFLEEAPLALAGARASESDARTNANLVVQHLLEQLTSGARVDRTLNAPATHAWFDPWKAHLKRLGVRFFNGTLERLEIDEAGVCKPVLSPRVHPPLSLPEGRRALADGSDCVASPSTTGHPPSPEDNDDLLEAAYHVLAVPLESAWEILEASGLEEPDAVSHPDVRALLRWRAAAKTERGGAADAGHWCDPLPGRAAPAGPFRTFSGVQLFFATPVRLGGEGHLWFPKTPWALTAIAQPPFWVSAPRSHHEGYLGLVSVDIGDFQGPYPPEPDGSVAPHPSTLSPEGIARETWRQIEASLPRLPGGARHQAPAWFHLDRFLHAGVSPREAPPSNAAPYLIPRPEDWPLRPGRPADPGSAFEYSTLGGLVVAGPHMTTHGRLTMTETANESARHAVNAILRDLESRTKVRVADPCPVWNMEDHEIDDLAPLKALDSVLHARGLPHFADSLSLDRLADLAHPLDLAQSLLARLQDA